MGRHQAFWRITFAHGTVVNLCGFAYKEYGTNEHVKIHRVHMYVRSRGFDTTVHPTCSAVGCTPCIFEGIVLLYLVGGQEYNPTE
jgi:hypothetical protein